MPTNQFLRSRDLIQPDVVRLRTEFAKLYRDVLGKVPEMFGAKDPSSVVIHWSRDWEYPWAVLSSAPRPGDKVLDCGCGGSPLLPFLAGKGCDAYGADPGLGVRSSLPRHWISLFKDKVWEVRSKKSSPLGALKSFLGEAIPPNDLWRYMKDPNRMGFKIQFFPDSLDKMRFADNTFDKVYCISVIEHLPEEVAFRGIREMARVLKPGGQLVMTVDYDGEHVTPALVGRFQDLIQASGLKVYGESDFSIPAPEEYPGTYRVVGFVLQK